MDCQMDFLNCNSYFLNGLSNDYCWSIFAANASFPESNGCSELEEIGKMIVERCDGLPLAAETLGRLLYSEHRVEEWKKILLSDIWRFPVANCKIFPALLISYYHRPAHLRRCFVYCSLYPKDHPFDKDELILLWMAENLLPPPAIGETLEDVGSKCFDDLASRLFFKQVENDDIVMHDLIHDLATFLAGKFYCRLSELGENEETRILTRHLSCDRPISRKPIPLNKFLRVLSFHDLIIYPDSIAKLIHLRYLDLSCCDFVVLPESICNLYNLQTLKLRSCPKLTMLPNGVYNLVNLRHLDTRDAPLKEMPKGMGKWKQLHILTDYIVGKQEERGIQELGGLLNLHGVLAIHKLENVADVNQARSARIIDKKHIEELLLEWSSGDDMVSNLQIERDVLDNQGI
ncbi:hypothetical protein PIB30_062235 [Stylosanthes scabra]|uniref:NB-ARC domain-containing protein n=1 Tax=Stylosanthes scabra TaxID=79078 RepID=A0ABU6TKV8_9FABA|nr:hypothetical protein [Stylosanthes scabra]